MKSRPQLSSILAVITTSLFGWTVTILMTVWAATYLYQCYLVLSQPGVPIELEYRTETGTQKFRADSFSIDPWNLSGTLTRGSIADDKGVSLIKADHISLKYESSVVFMNTRGLHVTLQRSADGRFDIQSILPRRDPGKFGPAFVFNAPTVVINYTDVSGVLLRRRAEVKNLAVSSDRGDVVANGLILVGGLQPASVFLQSAPDGRYWLRFPWLQGDATGLLPILLRFLPPEAAKEVASIEVNGLDMTGSLELASDGKTLGLGGNLFARSNRVVFSKGQLAGRLEARIQGSVERAHVQVSLKDSGNAMDFEGQLAFSKAVTLAGNFRANSAGRPWPLLAKYLPKGVSFRGASAEGWIVVANQKAGAIGKGRVQSLTAQGERLDNVDARFSLYGEALRVDLLRSTWRGGPLTAAVTTNTKSQAINGYASTSNRQISPLLASFGVKNVSGSGQAVALFGGKLSDPKADLFASGKARVQGEAGVVTPTGPFEVRANLVGSAVVVRRLTVSGPNGILVADGSADLKSKALNARFVAGAVPVALLNSEAEGTVFAQGTLKGTLENPVYVAHIEGYGLKYKDQGAPLLVSEISGNKNRLDIHSLQANSGTGLLEGNGSVDLRTKSVNGNFDAKNLALSQWFGSDLLGTVEVRNGVVSGKYDDPRITARVSGEKMHAYGASVDAVDLFLAASLDEVNVTDATVRIADGVVTGSGRYRLDDKTGSVSASATNLPLDRIVRPGSELDVDGRLGGSFEAALAPGGNTGKGTVNLSGVAVNETPLGAGTIDLDLAGNKLSAKGEIGSVDRYLGLETFVFDLEQKSADAEMLAYNLRVRDLIGATKPVWGESVGTKVELVESVDGAFTGRASLSANAEAWTLRDSDLTFDQLVVGGRPAGTVTAKVARSDNQWQISDFLWKSGDTSLTAHATYQEAGTVDLEANLAELDLSWLNVFSPETPVLSGRASATVIASGPRDDPSGRATINVRDATVLSSNGQSQSDPLQLFIDNFTFGNKRAELSGQANFSGFTGDISANVPYSALESGSRSRRREGLTAKVDFKDRPIQDFAQQLPDVDMDKSDGTVKLSADFAGLIEDLRVTAEASFQSNRIAFKNIDTELRNLSVMFNQNDRKAHLVSSGESSQGGSYRVDMNANLADVFGSTFSVDELLDESTLKGNAAFNEFRWAERLMGAELPTVAKVDGALQVDGTLRNPRISGDTTVENLVLNLPSELSAAAGGSLLIDPIMNNVRLNVAQGSRIETGVGALAVSGVGFLNGSLSEPDINIPLRLDSGTFRLPSGRLVLEPGGELIFNYSSFGGGEPVARVNLDIEGHTNVVSQRSTGQYETYQVTINIRGNVLDEKSLVLSATSDPADLSQDEILALIGQRDLIEGLAQGVLGGAGDRGAFRDAFYSIALPNFSQGLTQGLAQGLNLDYVSVDYNPFDQFMLRAGKTVGKGLVLEAARQLQNTGFGPTKWEVKLVYRLPLEDKFFSRLRLAFGIDQTVPWKLSVNWSRRF